MDTQEIAGKIIKIIKKIGPGNSNEFNLLPLVILIASFTIIIMYLIKIEININGTKWEKNKCSSKYVFFSGLMKNDGNGMEQALNNFNDCVRRFI